MQKNTNEPELHLNTNIILNVCQSTEYEMKKIHDIEPDNYLKSIQQIDGKIIFKLNMRNFISNLLEGSSRDSMFLPYVKEKMLIEFSSPNICKPFHVGHLRSTIIGNFISNLFNNLSHDVVRMNYLGDWGTQFGYLKVGVDLLNITADKMKTNPIKNLFEAYVHANKLAETNPSITEEARKIFHNLENDKFDDMNDWEMYRKYTVDELKLIYERLGVTFDEYCWESDYKQKHIRNIVNTLQNNNILHYETDGKQIAIINSNKRVPVIKSDGSTLYLTRDIAALVDRHERHKFNRIYYIVDNGQHDHFTALFDIARQLKLPYADSMTHIKFGRIKGMSTRKGNVVFLNDILDEAKSIMREKQMNSGTTKNDNDRVTDILGISSVIVNDLKQRRTKDYEFDWKRILQPTSGIKLQHTHCRLYNLEQNCGAQLVSHCIPELLQEPEAVKLMYDIARFPEVIHKTQDTLESCTLVMYLFDLW